MQRAEGKSHRRTGIRPVTGRPIEGSIALVEAVSMPPKPCPLGFRRTTRALQRGPVQGAYAAAKA